MKRFNFILVAVCAILACFMISCNSCKSGKTSNSEEVTEGGLVVERTISTDREYMFVNYGEDYRWFETCILLNAFLDEENCNPDSIVGVSNVFQAVIERGDSTSQSYDTEVVLFSHAGDESQIDVKHAFWVEDLPMNDEDITVTFKQAFERVMQANCPKPHSKQCVLRKQLGPKAANPQYIFGNTKSQLYVDAVTGEVSDINPVFGDVEGFKMPLGEWP